MTWDTESGTMMILSLIFTVAAALMLIGSALAHRIENRADREWREYMDSYAPGWRDRDGESGS